MATKKKPTKSKVEEPENDNSAYEAKNQEYMDAKAQASEAWDAVTAFKKKHKLKPGAKPEDKKLAKEYKELVDAHKALKETRDLLKEEAKGLKPKSERTAFARKYEYPDDIAGDKAKMKKYRTQQRALAAKAAKGEASEATPKKAKKSAPKGEAPVAKPSKKVSSKKKAAPVEDDDED